MKYRSLTHLSLLLLSFSVSPLRADSPEKVNFEKNVFPVFEKKCIKCHSTEHTDPDGKVKKPKGGFALDTPEGLKKGGKESKEKTLIPGKPEESSLYKVVMLPPEEDSAMPPKGKGDPLTAEEKETLKKWIAQGAELGSWKGATK